MPEFLVDSSLQTWKLSLLLSSRMWAFWGEDAGSVCVGPTCWVPGSHISTARKMYGSHSELQLQMCTQETGSMLRGVRGKHRGSCSLETRPVIWHQVPSPAVHLELTLLFRMFWDKP
jgi:hypothetical protein